jgi:signal transduction histidine kinase
MMPDNREDIGLFVRRTQILWILSALSVCLIVISSEFLVRDASDRHERDMNALNELYHQSQIAQHLALQVQMLTVETRDSARSALREDILIQSRDLAQRLEESPDPYTVLALDSGAQIIEAMREYLSNIQTVISSNAAIKRADVQVIERQVTEIVRLYVSEIAESQQERAKSLAVLHNASIFQLGMAVGIIILQTVLVVLPLLQQFRRKASQLQDQKRFVEKVGVSVPDTVTVFEMSTGRFLYTNKPTNIAEDAFTTPMKRLHTDDRALYQQIMRQCATLKEGEILTSELRFVLGPSQTRRMQNRYTPFHLSENGKPDQILAVSQDVTALRESEEQRKILVLEQDRAQILQDFIANASHDLRTPLASIQNQVGLMVLTEDKEKRTERMEKVKAQIQHIVRLLEQQQLLVRLDRMKSVDAALLPLINPIEQAVGVIRMMAAVKDVQVHEEYHTHPTLAIHAGHLTTAITAVLDNALRAAPAGSTITIRTLAGDHEAVIEVEDQGSGIPEHALPHVFERFYKVNEARTSDGSAAGLGLSVTQRIMELHGGRAEIFRTGSTGTAVRMILPMFVPAA